MAQAFFASRISENLAVTPEGFLLCTGVCIARTGWQKYTVRDLPQDEAEELGIDISDWSKSIDLYRAPEDVFDPATIASFEGKSVCDDHPEGFITAENFKEHSCGHIQNVRKGPEALESGDWPLLGDLLITVKSLIDKVLEKRKRELSCGYVFHIARVGDKILQVKITGNHVAVVDRGRAGSEARINDSAPVEEVIEQVQQSEAGKRPEVAQIKKEKYKVKNRFMDIVGRGFKAFAADEANSPEEIAEAARAYADQIRTGARGRDSEEETEEMRKEREGKDKAARDAIAKDAKDAADKKAKDEAEEEARKKREEAEDSEMDVHRIAKTPGDHRCKDCAGDGEKCHDCMCHDQLDDLLAKSKESKDGEMPELESLIEKHIGSGEEDAPAGEHDAESASILEPVSEEPEEKTMAMDRRRTGGKAEDVLAIIEPAIKRTSDKEVKKAFDSAPLHDGKKLLTHIRGAVARTKDTRVRGAFNAAFDSLQISRTSAGGYSEFATAAGKAHDAAATAKDPYAGINAASEQMLRGNGKQ